MATKCPLCDKRYETGERCPEDGATLLPESTSDPLVGMVLKDTYRVEEILGSGGLSVVYRARHISLGRVVAIKILRGHRAEQDEFIKRLFREARLISKLNHPHIVQVFDFGNTEDGLGFIVMEHLEGETLEAMIPKDRGMSLETIVELLEQICGAVQLAHDQQIVHRDLKPNNIIVSRMSGGKVFAKVLDFGISKPLSEGESKYTQPGMMLGTPGFVAPEQFSGECEIDTRADVYALGGILYQMASGKKPFAGDTLQTILCKQTIGDIGALEPEKMSDPRCVALRSVIDTAVQPDVESRYQTVSEFLSALRESTSIEGAAKQIPFSPKRLPRWAAAGLAVSLLVVIGIFIPGVSRSLSRLRNGEVVDSSTMQFPGVTATSVKLGMTGPFSGSARELGRSMQVGIETYFYAVNDNGGVHGRKLSLVARDDGYEPDRAEKNVDELIHEEEVFAFIGNVGTPTTEVSLPEMLKEKRILFAPFTGAGFLRKDPPDHYVFNYRASYSEETETIVNYLIEARGVIPRKIAVFAQDDSYGEVGFHGVKRALAKHGIHENEIFRLSYKRNTAVVEPATAAILKRRDEVEAVIIVATYAASARFIKILKDANFSPYFANVSFVGSVPLAQEFAQLGTEYGIGVIVTQVVPQFDGQSTLALRYQTDMKRYFPAEIPGFTSFEGYIAASLFVEGLNRTGLELTTETLAKAFESMTSVDLGIGAPLTFSPSDHQASDKVWATVLDENGRYQVLDL